MFPSLFPRHQQPLTLGIRILPNFFDSRSLVHSPYFCWSSIVSIVGLVVCASLNWTTFTSTSGNEQLYDSLESGMWIIKPEALKSYVWLQTADGSIQHVEEEVAMFCPMICREIIQAGMGSSKNHAISLPQRVHTSSLSLILDYCRFHQAPGRSNKERKSFDEKFVKIDTKQLCELTSAADSLQLRPLVDLTSRALARMIEGKSPEEIRDTFHLPDDITEEEKLEPLKNPTDDPQIRLLNRLYARKRKELKERKKLKDVEVKGELVDDRSVDDLLSFINGGCGAAYGTPPNQKDSI
ncbi:hypothetical protein J5N97_023579 [Dioscorea zingiberensis]|uniref:SKP1 component dimerisation domain-containing protein n=1 Tax=Dioscorea zingiberensis TaxID=325984 RepID=A0A9D5H849_9LILI|nr:hypothetical protein J5N97_023579 [Dioscorea zingiberensis]